MRPQQLAGWKGGGGDSNMHLLEQGVCSSKWYFLFKEEQSHVTTTGLYFRTWPRYTISVGISVRKMFFQSVFEIIWASS